MYIGFRMAPEVQTMQEVAAQDDEAVLGTNAFGARGTLNAPHAMLSRTFRDVQFALIGNRHQQVLGNIKRVLADHTSAERRPSRR